ncbi:MAG: GGDEF domain-containing protein [bacterium JZ-2024 1]
MAPEKPTVLVAEEETELLALLRGALEGEFEVTTASAEPDILRKVSHHPPDLIFLDLWGTPDESFRVARRVLEAAPRKPLPVLIATGRIDRGAFMDLLDMGPVDYIRKPFDAPELLMKMRSLLRIISAMNDQAAQYKPLLIVDELTGLYNRRYLIARIEEEVERFRRYEDVFSVLLVDLDQFRSVNETYGRAVGDGVLCQTAELLRASVRKSDVLGRWDRDDFMVIATDTSPEGSQIFAERLRQKLETCFFKVGQWVINLTGTIVILSVRDLGSVSTDEVISQVFDLLSGAQERGPNRVIYARSGGRER